jgi:hypothetical protein
VGTRPTHTASYPPLRPGDLSRGLHHHHPCSPPLPASSIVAGPFIPSYLSFADAAPPSGELNARPLHTLPLCHNSQTSPCRTPRTPTNHAELPGRRRHAVVVAKPFGLADRCVCARRPVLSGTRRPRSCFRRTTRAGLLPPRGRASGAPPSQSRGVCAFNVSFQKRCLATGISKEGISKEGTSSHSLRRGGTTQLALAGVPESFIQAHGRRASLEYRLHQLPRLCSATSTDGHAACCAAGRRGLTSVFWVGLELR